MEHGSRRPRQRRYSVLAGQRVTACQSRLTVRSFVITDLDPIHDAAIAKLRELIDEARRRGDEHGNACALATAGPDARPSVRTVNIARVAASGLVLFASTESGKARHMLLNPRAALCFHWPLLSYQAIVEGAVAPLADAEADVLWNDQPREKALSRWASDPTASSVEAARLHDNLQTHRQNFSWQAVPRPPTWQAFEIQADRIDFWPTGWQRLRVRQCYLKSETGGWQLTQGNP